MNDEQRNLIKIVEKINDNILEKKWACVNGDCEENAINSHLIQQNGILRNITKDNHFIEAKLSNPHTWDANKPPITFKRIGITNALSLKIFCSKHDSELFRPIENSSQNFETYESFLLFSYRSTSAELRKKEIEIERCNRLLNSNILKERAIAHGYNDRLLGLKLGFGDILSLKNDFEEELIDMRDRYTFCTIRYPKFEVYASTFFSANDIEENVESPTHHLESIYLHLLPLKDEFLILIGYHNDYKPHGVDLYIESWKNLSRVNLEKKITTLFLMSSENWGISTELFKQIKNESKVKFIDTLLETMNQFGISQNADFNLFE